MTLIYSRYTLCFSYTFLIIFKQLKYKIWNFFDMLIILQVNDNFHRWWSESSILPKPVDLTLFLSIFIFAATA
jgi:hypothetical protein